MRSEEVQVKFFSLQLSSSTFYQYTTNAQLTTASRCLGSCVAWRLRIQALSPAASTRIRPGSANPEPLTLGGANDFWHISVCQRTMGTRQILPQQSLSLKTLGVNQHLHAVDAGIIDQYESPQVSNLRVLGPNLTNTKL